MFRSIAAGVREATRRPGLVLLLWAWHTVLALVVTLPAWGRLTAATGVAPETDALLAGLQLGTLLELLQQHSEAVAVIVATVAALAGVALIANAFLAGGILEVLIAGDGRPLFHRFFRGAGHFFFRSLRLLAIVTAAVVVAGGLAAATVSAVFRPFADRGSEPASFFSGVLALAAVALVAGIGVLVLDYARVMLVREDARGTVRLAARAAWFVFSHPLAAGGIGIFFALLVAGILSVAAWIPLAAGATTWAAIAGAAILQQVLVAARIGSRVAQMAAQAQFLAAATPARTAVVPAPQPEPGRSPIPDAEPPRDPEPEPGRTLEPAPPPPAELPADPRLTAAARARPSRPPAAG